MWEPRRLTTLWASTACYRDSFTSYTTIQWQETRKEQTSIPTRFHSRVSICSLGLPFGLEDGGSMFLWSYGGLIPDYTASHPRKQYSYSPDWELQNSTKEAWRVLSCGMLLLCRSLKDNGRFGGTCHLHIQGWIVRQTGNLREADTERSFAYRLL
jgi:hypothetical protein